MFIPEWALIIIIGECFINGFIVGCWYCSDKIIDKLYDIVKED